MGWVATLAGRLPVPSVQTVAQSVIRRLNEAEESHAAAGTRINIPSLFADSIRDACATVFDTARHDHSLMGMGSTVTALMMYGSVAWIGHVGDSRAYLIRDGAIHQLTEDHSLVQEQVSAGLITPEQAKNSLIRNIITRSIGFEREVKVDTGAIPIYRGDHFLLCSDGLTGHVEDHEILDVVENTPRRNVPTRLIEMANSRGGDDNCTVTLTTVTGRRGRQREKRRRGKRG